jgi:hypothetical protein
MYPNIIYFIGYGVIETTDAEASLTRVDELIPEMQVVRHEMKLTAMLLAVVDIVHLTSTPFIAGPTEMSLALAAYGGETIDNGKALEVTGLVSRKKDFVPMLTGLWRLDGNLLPQNFLLYPGYRLKLSWTFPSLVQDDRNENLNSMSSRKRNQTVFEGTVTSTLLTFIGRIIVAISCLQ